MNSHQAKLAADVAAVRSGTDNIAEDTLAGADAIGRYIGKSRRQTFYLARRNRYQRLSFAGSGTCGKAPIGAASRSSRSRPETPAPKPSKSG